MEAIVKQLCRFDTRIHFATRRWKEWAKELSINLFEWINEQTGK